MFSATISGKIKRIIHDNEESKEKAMLKVVVECRKQFVRKDDMPFNYPVVTIFGNDADYLREYAGAGHFVMFHNCDVDVYKKDEDSEERTSFKSGKVELLPKEFTDQIEVEEEEEPRRKKKTSSSSKPSSKKSGKSRSELRKGRGRDDEDEDEDDDDDEDEDEAPRRKKKPATTSKSKKTTKSSSKSRRSRDDDDEDEDDEDDDFYDDED